jgi:hypothetical protein
LLPDSFVVTFVELIKFEEFKTELFDELEKLLDKIDSFLIVFGAYLFN